MALDQFPFTAFLEVAVRLRRCGHTPEAGDSTAADAAECDGGAAGASTDVGSDQQEPPFAADQPQRKRPRT